MRFIASRVIAEVDLKLRYLVVVLWATITNNTTHAHKWRVDYWQPADMITMTKQQGVALPSVCMQGVHGFDSPMGSGSVFTGQHQQYAKGKDTSKICYCTIVSCTMGDHFSDLLVLLLLCKTNLLLLCNSNSTHFSRKIDFECKNIEMEGMWKQWERKDFRRAQKLFIICWWTRKHSCKGFDKFAIN